jgi:Secretion system C-terminal sorting domain
VFTKQQQEVEVMKTRLFVVLSCVLVLVSLTAYGQMMKRTDAVWARNTTATITLDGKLNEAAWASAESLRVQMGKDSGIPGGGWYWENGLKPGVDPTDAIVKFLAKGDTLYVGIVCKDKSIGGGLFNHFDGLLMNLRYRDATGFAGNPYRNRMNQANEIFYGWVTESWADTTTAEIGAMPAFLGDWGSAYVHPRPDSLKEFWDAATYVQGTTNDDATPDTLWSTELKFNLKKFNYNVTQTGGDIVMWGVQIYDADYQWPLDTLKQAGNRVWVQSPWGNASAYNHLRIFVRSDVTTSSGSAPVVPADYVIKDGKNYATPTLDGKLTEDVWKYAPSLAIKYGDAATRNAYANTAKYRSGQEQPTVNGAQNPVVDANTVTVKYFFKGDSLYLGFDVRDKFVQAIPDFDRWDGFRVIMEQRNDRNGDSVLTKRRFTFRVDTNATASREEDLSKAGWDSLGQAVRVALSLKGGTTIDTLGTTADSGYTAEMRIDLTKMGYPSGRGDGVVFLSVAHFDGDSFSGGSYGTRVWFMRPGDFDDGSAWFYMDPTAVITSVGDETWSLPGEFALLGNYPNPFNPSTQIRFRIAQASDVTLDVYDITGRRVSSKALGVQTPGEHSVTFDAHNMASGTYFYRLKNTAGATLIGKMMLLK